VLENEHVTKREFPFTFRDFKVIAGILNDHAGISLRPEKEAMVYGRLAGRIRRLGLPSVRAYIKLIDRKDSDEFTNFVNALTTNVTSFFREDHHFRYISNTFLPEVYAASPYPQLRIWSAGCSVGMEPYSIAIALHETMEKMGPMDAKILATDINSSVLDMAREGVYDPSIFEEVSKTRQMSWFEPVENATDDLVRVKSALREMVSFRCLNLMAQWPMKGPFDMIFCRNVVIYFDRQVQLDLFRRFAKILRPGGLLILGYSESLGCVANQFDYCGKTIYRRRTECE